MEPSFSSDETEYARFDILYWCGISPAPFPIKLIMQSLLQKCQRKTRTFSEKVKIYCINAHKIKSTYTQEYQPIERRLMAPSRPFINLAALAVFAGSMDINSMPAVIDSAV